MWQSFRSFARAVGSRWWLLIPGIAGGADWVFGLAQRWVPGYEPPVTGDIGVVILFAGGLVLASFLAFHDQRVETMALITALNERAGRARIATRLDEFVQLGNALRSGAARTADDAALASLTTQTEAWATAVRDYLDEEGTGLVGLFLSDSVPMQQFTVAGFDRWSLLTNYLGRRLFQLGEIVKRYQSSSAAISSQDQT
jgi:hypothetical protein